MEAEGVSFERKPLVYSEHRRQLAVSNGKFYNGLIDTYLTHSSSEDRDLKVNQLLDSLPAQARDLYGVGLVKFRAELQGNAQLIANHPGQEVPFLISSLLTEDGREADIPRITPLFTPENSHYIEPSPGVPLIQVEKELYYRLAHENLVNPASSAVCFASEDKKDPTFMIVQRMSRETGLDMGGTNAAEKASARHEFHHLIWNFLKRANFVQKTTELDPSDATAFDKFRDELTGYIIENKDLRYLDPQMLVHTADQSIQDKADHLKNIAIVCMRLAEQTGGSTQDYLYPAMVSRNFAELGDNFIALTDISKLTQHQVLQLLRNVWTVSQTDFAKPLREFIDKKQFDLTETDSFIRQQIDNPSSLNVENQGSIANYKSAAVEMDRFSKNVLNSDTDINSVLFDVLKNKTALPPEALKKILGLPERVIGRIPVTNNPVELVRGFISLWYTDNKQYLEAYKLVVNASPQLKAAFEQLQKEIIEKDVEDIKKEMGYYRADSAAKAQIETMLDGKLAPLNQL